jgi:hypothetical protein
MQALPVTYNKIPEPPKFLKVYSRKKLIMQPKAKTHPFYPKILMPEQPIGYIKQRNNDCW